MPQSENPSGDAHASPGIIWGIEAWRQLVERNLGGSGIDSLQSRTRDGIPIAPLYERSRDGTSLAGRGACPWTIVQTIGDADPERTNERAIAALAAGATGLALRFSSTGSGELQGLPPTREALHAALDGIDLAKVHLRIDPHADGLRIAELLTERIAASGLAPERVDVAFGLDPVAAMSIGAAPEPARFSDALMSLDEAHFRGPLALLDGRDFHEAGATEAQELAAILGAAAWWLRTLDDAGIAPSSALSLLGASVSVDLDVLVSIAKIRALRLLWARMQELCAGHNTALRVHAETSRRMLTRTDPLDNLLRNTLAAFAAGVGGADSLAIAPHTAALGIDDRNGRALARNIQHLLMQESHIHQVDDPAMGSGAIEALTEALAKRAWEEFGAIEREGGIVESLAAGLVQARIAAAADTLPAEAAP